MTESGGMIICITEYTKKHWIVYFKWVNCMACKLYFNKAIFQIKKKKQIFVTGPIKTGIAIQVSIRIRIFWSSTPYMWFWSLWSLDDSFTSISWPHSSMKKKQIIYSNYNRKEKTYSEALIFLPLGKEIRPFSTARNVGEFCIFAWILFHTK